MSSVHNFYEHIGAQYSNPHKEYVYKCLDDLVPNFHGTVLDFACGTGDVSKYFSTNKCIGVDKYLHNEYIQLTDNKCYQYSFEDIADFKFNITERIDLIVCSYAIDLVPGTYLNKLLYSLSTVSKNLVLVRPNSHIIPDHYWKVKSKTRHLKSKAVLYEALRVC